MATEVILPKLGLTMEEGVLSAWNKAVGESVSEGEIIALIETEKIETELPAPVTGTITQLLVAEGDTVPVGAVIAVIE